MTTMTTATPSKPSDLSPAEVVSLIRKKRSQREAIRAAFQQQFADRLVLVERVNTTKAALDEATDALLADPGNRRLAAQVAEAKDARDKAQAEHTAALKRQRELGEALKRAGAGVELAIGGVDAGDLPALAGIHEPERLVTNRDIRQMRQSRARDAAVVALRAMGGRGSCNDLARMLGLSPHGIGGLIDGDPRLEKFHEGRQCNLESWYRLTPAGMSA